MHEEVEDDETFAQRMEQALALAPEGAVEHGDDALKARVWAGIQAGMTRQEGDTARSAAGDQTCEQPREQTCEQTLARALPQVARAVFLGGIIALSTGYAWMLLARSL
jgi:hypothetical protein